MTAEAIIKNSVEKMICDVFYCDRIIKCNYLDIYYIGDVLMHPLNLFAVTRKTSLNFVQYESILSHREKVLRENVAEQNSLSELVDELCENTISVCKFNGFYFGYSIPQIGKEFDLLKISNKKDAILNIELKSEMKPEAELKKQLKMNRYYLSHITKNILSFSFISDQKRCFKLDSNEEIIECDFCELIDSINSLEQFYEGDINSLFDPSKFLVSPINTPKRFIEEEYFLTNHQDEICNQFVKKITEYMKKPSDIILGVSGGAGTGKTLLLYDIARYCARLDSTCVIHCGKLTDGHLILEKTISNLNILPIKDIDTIDVLKNYKYIFVDEAQRIWPNQLGYILDAVNKMKRFCAFFFDRAQYLSKQELNNKFASTIEEKTVAMYKLTDKIRTNDEMASFIKQLFDLNKKNTKYSYDNIEILYANNIEEAQTLIQSYNECGYTFINYTHSKYNDSIIDRFTRFENYNSHEVLGQEFDDVILFIGPEIYYHEHKIYSSTHPNPNYLYHKMLFQSITRVRKRLCIVVLNNPDMFQILMKIKLKDL